MDDSVIDIESSAAGFINLGYMWNSLIVVPSSIKVAWTSSAAEMVEYWKIGHTVIKRQKIFVFIVQTLGD